MNLAIVAVSLFLLMTSCETLPSQGILAGARHERALSPVAIGTAAARALLKGAQKSWTKSSGYDKYVKKGTKSDALKDFWGAEPTDVKKYFDRFGVAFYEGKIGDRIIYYHPRDKGLNKPTITIYDPKRLKQGTENLSDKIVYVRALDKK